ncbi:MAG: cupredoxin domain-containing protein [Actinomycetota bacterium]
MKTLKQAGSGTKMCVALVAILLLGACGGKADKDPKKAPEAEQSEGGHMEGKAAPCEPSGNSLSLSAENLKFDKSCLGVPADQAFTVAFNNKEAVPHNFEILKSHGSSKVIFPAQQPPLTGPGDITYQVPALKAGTFHFHCSIHPDTMQGVFVVK